jgi:UPF0042 nucleotide-binding protein
VKPTTLVLITGLSGSGKSTVAKCFEDLGFYCVDNLPLPLLRQFLHDPFAQVEGHRRIAVVTDVRAPGFAREFPPLVAELDRAQIHPTLLFLEASEDALVRRFSETRRPHPLAVDRGAIEGIRQEREMLADVKGAADIVLDTSDWSIHEARDEVYRAFAAAPGEEPSLAVSLVSFGFKHGIPSGADLLFDARFLANPHFVPELRPLTGRDAPVREYLEAIPDYEDFVNRLEDFLGYLLPRYQKENRAYLSVGVGCTGGHHRSVAVVEEL